MRRVTDRRYRQEKVHGHYFLDLTLENVRCFGKKQVVQLAHQNGRPHHWTIILGENGTGKSTLLKALVAVAPSPKDVFRSSTQLKLYPGMLDWQRQWDPRRVNAKSPPSLEANVVAGYGLRKLVTSDRLLLQVCNVHVGSPNAVDYSEETYSQLGDFLCFAYGASRRMGRAGLKSDNSRAGASLFDDDASLINVEEFFMQADYDAKTSRSKESVLQREKVRQLLIDILPDVTDLRISKRTEARSRAVEVKSPFGWVPLEELSLGYKSLIAWMVDFASRMFRYHRTFKNPFEAPAVVLVDEIDLHLHPAWQRKILGYLSRKFPNTQFIATAHSPLIVQAALGANLVLLKRVGSQVIVDNTPDVIRNWRIDQILTSDIFGLSSARGERTEKLLRRRRTLLSKSALTKGDEKTLDKIEREMGPIPVAETQEYIQAMQIVEKIAHKG